MGSMDEIDDKIKQINKIKIDIICLIDENWNQNLKRKEFHEKLKTEICQLAKSYDYQGKIEYKLPHYRNKHGYRGIIDVVWFKTSSPTIYFEIDSCLKKKSIEKLLFTQNSILFWINYGKKDPNQILKERDPDQRINLIRFENLAFQR